MAAALASLTKNLPSFNEALEGLSIPDHNRNTTAALLSLTKNLQSVDEALQGLSILDHKRDKAATVASLIEKFRTASEAFEGLPISDLMLNMPAAVPSLTENFQCVNAALEIPKKSLLKRSQIDELLELAKRTSNETLTLPCFDYFEQFGEGNFTIAPELFQSAQEFSTAGRSRGVLRSSENLGLQGLSISDHKRNMAAALASLTEIFQTVNEALEGLFVSHHKRNMAAALASLIENLQTVNEALEGLYISDLKLKMPAAVPSLTENFQSVNVALEKAKKDLLQRVQIFDEKKNEQPELSRLIMKENLTPMGVDDLVQSSDGKSTKAPDRTNFAQDFRNAGASRGLLNPLLEKAMEHFLQSVNIDEREKFSKLFMNEVPDVAELMKDNDELNYAAERLFEADAEISECKKETALLIRLFDSVVQSAEGQPIQASVVTQFPQEFKNAGTSRGLLPFSANLGLKECI